MAKHPQGPTDPLLLTSSLLHLGGHDGRDPTQLLDALSHSDDKPQHAVPEPAADSPEHPAAFQQGLSEQPWDAGEEASTYPPDGSGGGEAAGMQESHEAGSKGAGEVNGVTERELRRIMPYLPQWTVWPDYERASNMNHIIHQLWPSITTAIQQMVAEQLPPMVSELLSSYKIPFVQSVQVDCLDFGQESIRVGGVKSYETNQDEVIVEAAVVWPSDMRVTVSILLAMGPIQIRIPIKVSNPQLQGTVRCTMKPLLEEMPCIGSIAATLLGDPYITTQLAIGNGPDLLSIPGLRQVTYLALQAIIRRLLVYPNQVWLDVVPHGGVPTPPSGLLVVKVIKCKSLTSDDIISKADAYCLVQIREGRALKTKTVFNTNNPVFNQEFQLVVDEPEVQTMAITVKDDDFGWGDSALGVAEISLKDAVFIQSPNTMFPLILDLYRPPPQDVGGLMALPLDLFGLPGKVVKGGGRLVGGTWKVVGAGAHRPDSASDGSGRSQQEKKQAAPALQPQTISDTEASSESSQDADRRESNSQDDEGTSDGSDTDRPADNGAPSEQGSGSDSQSQPTSDQPTTPSVPAPKKGLVPADKKGKKAGKVFLEVTYLPFAVPKEPLEEVVEVLGMPVRRRRQTQLASVHEDVKEDDKGVLTVNVIRATNLGGWEREPDPYVVVKVTDKLQGRVEQQKTSTMFNELSPRWSQKFDFAMISAGTTLQLNVFDRTTAWQTLTSFDPNLKARFKDKMIGKLRFNVLDIAKAGRVRDSWPLTDVQQGDLELELSWLSATFSQNSTKLP